VPYVAKDLHLGGQRRASSAIRLISMSSTLPPNTLMAQPGGIVVLASWRGVFSNAVISIQPTILKRACPDYLEVYNTITPIRIVGRIRDNPWCERHHSVALVANNVRPAWFSVRPNDLNVSFIHQALQAGRCITGSELMKWTSRVMTRGNGRRLKG